MIKICTSIINLSYLKYKISKQKKYNVKWIIKMNLNL